MEKINDTINQYFGLILLVATLTGLVLPAFLVDTNLVIMIALAFIIFVSFFKVPLNKELFLGDLKYMTLFFIVRFLLLPVLVYLALIRFSDYYAVVMFLLLILPAAVSSPAFANMFNGNIALALKIMVFSSFLSIFSLPFLSKLILGGQIDIQSKNMFFAMVYTIVLPFLLHLPFKRSAIVSAGVVKNSPLLTIFGLATIYVLATMKNREVILANPLKVFWYALLSLVVFLVLYIAGYYMYKKKGNFEKISYSICSGANNVGLGVTITSLFFPENVSIFFITAQLAWIAALIPIRYFFYKKG